MRIVTPDGEHRTVQDAHAGGRSGHLEKVELHPKGGQCIGLIYEDVGINLHILSVTLSHNCQNIYGGHGSFKSKNGKLILNKFAKFNIILALKRYIHEKVAICFYQVAACKPELQFGVTTYGIYRISSPD